MTVFNQYKKILLAVLLLFFLAPLRAQQNPADIAIDWNKINLAGPEAKILASSIPVQEQYLQLIDRSFETKEGKITVYLPPLSYSVTLSGTVYLAPTGKDSSRNLIGLQSYRLSLGDLDIPVQRGSFQFTFPADPGNGMISLQLKNNKGQIIQREELPVTKATVTGSGFIIPPYIVSGDQAIIRGNFDGNMTNISVTINREKAELLAESASQLFFTTSANQTGHVTVVCTENGNTQTAASNLLKLDLSVPKTNLLRGEKTEVHIQISGLEGLTTPVPVKITNTSPSVIMLEGGNTQQITLNPRNDAPSGVFVTTRNIQSQKNGDFSVSVYITPFAATVRQ